jgi:hypothetical protein
LGNSVYDTNVVDQVENYMSYNTCQNMLSEGQKVRMRGFIASFPTLVGLSTDSNLYATGVIDAIPAGVELMGEKANKAAIAPNPFNNSIDIAVGDADIDQIRMTNIMGQEVGFRVSEQGLAGGGRQFRITVAPDLKAGIYFLLLDTKSGTLIKKMIKG